MTVVNKETGNEICKSCNQEIEEDDEGFTWSEFFIGFSTLMFIVWLLANTILGIGGWQDSGRTSCRITFRSDYAFPGRKLGCWLGAETEASTRARKIDE